MPATASAHDRLLDAAEATLLRDGIGTTGVDAVLAAAGVATATLYARFGSKDGLLVAVLERRLERWTAVWEAEIAAAEAPADRLLAVFAALERFRDGAVDRRACPFLATTVELPSPDHPTAAVRRTETARLDARLVELATETGVADAPALARAVRVAYDGALGAEIRGEGTAGVAPARRLASLAVAAAGA